MKVALASGRRKLEGVAAAFPNPQLGSSVAGRRARIWGPVKLPQARKVALT